MEKEELAFQTDPDKKGGYFDELLNIVMRYFETHSEEEIEQEESERRKRTARCSYGNGPTTAELGPHHAMIETLEELNIPIAYKYFEMEIPPMPYIIFQEKGNHKTQDQNKDCKYEVQFYFQDDEEHWKTKVCRLFEHKGYVVTRRFTITGLSEGASKIIMLVEKQATDAQETMQEVAS